MSVTIAEHLHGTIVANRRVRVLAGHLASLLPPRARVLDIGCGDGRLAAELLRVRDDLAIEGADVLVRPETAIPVHEFDGEHLPWEANRFDAALLIDVLHHTDDPNVLLAEAVRVASDCVLLKDHTRDGWRAGPTLRFMDTVGNRRFGVSLPYNYLSTEEWRTAFNRAGLAVASWETRLGLYPQWAQPFFEHGLHVLAKLRPVAAE